MLSRANVSTEILRKLHRIHRQLADLRVRLERGPKQIHAHETNVKHQEELLEQTQAAAKTFRVATDAKQLQFKTKEDRVKELRVKLNAASSNREYQALKDQIAADEMTNSVLADEILEALEKSDGYQAQIAVAKTAVTKAREEAQRIEKEIQEREPALRTDIDRLDRELRECEAALPEEIREVYRRIAAKKGEDALAPVLNGEYYFCGGCNQQIPLNMYNALTLSHPVFCKSCGRLLYISEEQDSPA